MKCKCGETEFEPGMSMGPIHHLGGAEIGFFHNGMKCGWAYECQDCWGSTSHVNGQFGSGMDTEDEARKAMQRHQDFYCPPNWQAMTDEERATNVDRRASWERYCSAQASIRMAEAVRDGWDG